MKETEIQPGLWLDSRRAVYFEPLGLLALADLHWGYAASHQVAGNLLPSWGDDEITGGLNGLISDYQPTEMIWLGDSLHDLTGQRAAEEFLDKCGVPVVLLPGNHDRKWKITKERSICRGSYFFHHGDIALAPPVGSVEVTGHFHPAFSWYDGAGARVKLPGLVRSPKRIILPAFSPWAAGTPWNSELADDEELWVISPRRIFSRHRAVAPQSAALEIRATKKSLQSYFFTRGDNALEVARLWERGRKSCTAVSCNRQQRNPFRSRICGWPDRTKRRPPRADRTRITG